MAEKRESRQRRIAGEFLPYSSPLSKPISPTLPVLSGEPYSDPKPMQRDIDRTRFVGDKRRAFV